MMNEINFQWENNIATDNWNQNGSITFGQTRTYHCMISHWVFGCRQTMDRKDCFPDALSLNTLRPHLRTEYEFIIQIRLFLFKNVNITTPMWPGFRICHYNGNIITCPKWHDCYPRLKSEEKEFSFMTPYIICEMSPWIQPCPPPNYASNAWWGVHEWLNCLYQFVEGNNVNKQHNSFFFGKRRMRYFEE